MSLRQFTRWCHARSLSLFSVRRAGIETFARDWKHAGAPATVTRRPGLLTRSIIIDTTRAGRADKILEQMRRSPQNVRFDDLAKVCADHFGEPRQDGTSHKVYKTPWQGDPRVNIQRGKDGNAKAYQVRQVLDAIARLEAEEKEEESDDDA